MKSAKRYCTGQTARLRLAQGVVANGQELAADPDLAVIEMELCHVFPVRTTDGTAMLPGCVARSCASMRNKMLNLAHLVKSYDPTRIERDRILGSVMWSEWTAAVDALPAKREEAPGMRCVATLFKAADGSEQILRAFADGHPWTVSMENAFAAEACGVGVRGDAQALGATKTPEMLQKLGYAYWPWNEAPEELQACIDWSGSARVERSWQGLETTLFVGGLDGAVRFTGVGMTPVGKEPTAQVVRVMAGLPWAEADQRVLELLGAMRRMIEAGIS